MEENLENPEQFKKLLTESTFVCIELLKSKDFIYKELSRPTSEEVYKIGNEMADLVINFFENLKCIECDELIEINEENDGQMCTENLSNNQAESEGTSEEDLSSSQNSSEYEPEEKKSKFEIVPLEKKIEIVNLKRQHPNWKYSTMRVHGGRFVPRLDELTRWSKEITSGGTFYDKTKAIKKWTYSRFVEARERKDPITTDDLRIWAVQGSMQFKSEDFQFTASPTWLKQFKKDFKITQRRVTKYVKQTERRSAEEIEISSALFQEEIKNLAANINLDFIINTDQMGCEYRVNVSRTLEHRGERTVEVYLGDINKITHSYTAQYTITASGKLIPKVFICLQETSGKFGPRVQEKINLLLNQCKNVFVECSKSGKLTSDLVLVYNANVLEPYVKSNNFVHIIDSWSGHAKPKLYESFKNEEGESSCMMKIIPPNCTPFCQPLDVYLHRQIKLFIKKIQNCTEVIQNNYQLNTREDAITIHSLIHHQLSAPLFRNMIQYSWYASRLIEERDVFMNVTEVCFPKKRDESCSCGNITFIHCSWCREFLCFSCFYNLFHPQKCKMYFSNL